MVESSEEKKKKTTLPYLYHELIVQILMWLPVKSLTRFKCVCKSWFSLISDPHFANSHFQLTSATHTPRIMSISTLSHKIRSIDFEAFLNDDPASLNLNFSLPESYFPVEFRGSCRGFILLYKRQFICIWNPSTGFKKQIPGSHWEFSKSVSHCHGLGYDQSRDDYLVVSLSYNGFSPHWEFFSFRDNTWKEIESTRFPYAVIPYHRKGCLFNGAIHWLVMRHDLGWNGIVAFDLMERKLFEMPLPSDFDHAIDSGLWVFGEFLSIWVKDTANDTIEIWVMKEYKMHSSWTKTLVLPQHVIPGHYFNPLYYSRFADYFHPMHSTENGDIIGKYGGTRLVKYNDKGQFLGHHSFSNSPSEVVVYSESLLSLSGDNEHV